jgi:hypothetical protein
MDSADMLRELAVVMSSSDNDNGGCLEFCDGEPVALRAELRAILLASVDMIGNDEPDPSAQAALIERAKRFGAVVTEVEGVCARECDGAYSLFENDADMYDLKGNPVVRTCPIKDRLAQIALNFSEPQS